MWSESVRAQLLSASDAEKSEMEIAQADSEIVATLVQSLYEKEVMPLTRHYDLSWHFESTNNLSDFKYGLHSLCNHFMLYVDLMQDILGPL